MGALAQASPVVNAAPVGAVSRILVVAEHSLIADAVVAALADRGFEVAAGDLRALTTTGAVPPRLGPDPERVLLLCELEPFSRLQRAREVVGRIAVPWVLLTDATPGPLWGAMLEAGVETVMSNAAGLDAVVAALRAPPGEPHGLPAPVRARLTEEWQDYRDIRESWDARIGSLSPRERSVLTLLYEGFSVPEIADLYQVSETTVRSQVRGVLVKLGVTSQLAAVAAYASFQAHQEHRRPTERDHPRH